MDSNTFKDVLDINRLKEKIYKIKIMYHPNLIANLSKEMYDRYKIRMSLCEELLTLLEQSNIDKEQIKQHFEKKIVNIQD